MPALDAGERRSAISYRELFNSKTGSATIGPDSTAAKDLDSANTVGAMMGNFEVEGNSVNGRMATGSAASADHVQLREKRKKRDAELIETITRLRSTLAAIDNRIAELDLEISDLEQQRIEALARSELAFEKMHELEALVAQVEDDGITRVSRDRLRQAISEDSQKPANDTLLLELARVGISTEQRAGAEAYADAERLRQLIEDKQAAKRELEQAREQILSDPSSSVEEKSELLQQALEQSMSSVARAAQIADYDTEVSLDRDFDRERTGQLPNEIEVSDFEFDENTTIVIPTTSGFSGPG